LLHGTIVVTEGEESNDRAAGQVAIYARVSSHEHCANLERQAERLENYCAAKGYQVSKVVKEIGSGVNDNRAKFLALLELKGQGRAIEVVNLADNNREDLLADLVRIVYAFAARLYGQRRAKRKTEAIVKQLQAEEGEKP